MIRSKLSISLAVWLMATLFFAAGCKKSQPVATPLPVAWPRLPIAAADTMRTLDGLPVEVAVNPAATYTVVDSKPMGLTVHYPSVDVDIYYTFIPVETADRLEEVVDSRLQRISLNLKGADARTLHGVDNDENVAVMVVATSGTQTPVQLLATLPGYVVTATSFINDANATTAYDSIRPLFEAIEKDMSRSLPGFVYDSTK